MAAIKAFAYERRICALHGPFHQDNWHASDLFDECPLCEQDADQRADYEAATVRLSWAIQEVQDFERRDAVTNEVPVLDQVLALLLPLMQARQSVALATGRE
jgi:hypothetical protein